MSKNSFNIENEELEAVILQMLNKPDGYLTEDDLSAVEKLELPEGINSLRGINYFKNLKSVAIKDVYLCMNDLQLIRGLEKLEHFGMYYDYFNPPPRRNISLEFLGGVDTTVQRSYFYEFRATLCRSSVKYIPVFVLLAPRLARNSH